MNDILLLLFIYDDYDRLCLYAYDACNCNVSYVQMGLGTHQQLPTKTDEEGAQCQQLPGNRAAAKTLTLKETATKKLLKGSLALAMGLSQKTHFVEIGTKTHYLSLSFCWNLAPRRA